MRTAISTTLGLTLCTVLAWFSATPVSAQARDGGRLGGHWEGHVQFVAGQRARVSLEVVDDAGTYTLTPLGEEGPETPTTGAITLAPAADGVSVQIKLAGRADARADGRVARAGSHAELALYGLFDGGQQGQGTFIVWRYRR